MLVVEHPEPTLAINQDFRRLQVQHQKGCTHFLDPGLFQKPKTSAGQEGQGSLTWPADRVQLPLLHVGRVAIVEEDQEPGKPTGIRTGS